MKKPDNVGAIVAMTGTVISDCTPRPDKENVEFVLFDILSNAPGGAMTVRIKAQTNDPEHIKKGDRIAIIAGKLFVSGTNKASTFGVSVTKENIRLIDTGDDEAVDATSISLIATVDSPIRYNAGHAEFIVKMDSPNKKAFTLHVTAEGLEKEHCALRPGDKIGIFGAQVEQTAANQSGSFAVRTDADRLHLIPFYEGEENAEKLMEK